MEFFSLAALLVTLSALFSYVCGCETGACMDCRQDLSLPLGG